MVCAPALFSGTGNCTKKVSSVLLARVFNDDRLRLYDYDPVRFRQAPKMFAFQGIWRGVRKNRARCGSEAEDHARRARRRVERRSKRC